MKQNAKIKELSFIKFYLTSQMFLNNWMHQNTLFTSILKEFGEMKIEAIEIHHYLKFKIFLIMNIAKNIKDK